MGERALIMTNNGETDAEMFRVDNMQHRYLNLIQIPVSYIPSNNVVFSKNADFQVNGWESLRPYIIALRTGFKQAEMGTEGMKRYLTDGSEQAFMMLANGRVQIVVEEHLTGLDYIRQLNLKVSNCPLKYSQKMIKFIINIIDYEISSCQSKWVQNTKKESENFVDTRSSVCHIIYNKRSDK
ncbi:hypothetical protein GMMP15_1080001 [Candidatus Magnetomoraceae bacterium gMMP-15]